MLTPLNGPACSATHMPRRHVDLAVAGASVAIAPAESVYTVPLATLARVIHEFVGWGEQTAAIGGASVAKAHVFHATE